MEENNVVMNEETTEVKNEAVQSTDDGTAAGIALLVGVGVAGTIAAQQLYKKALAPFGRSIRDKWKNRKKKPVETEKSSDGEVVVQEENAE